MYTHHDYILDRKACEEAVNMGAHLRTHLHTHMHTYVRIYYFNALETGFLSIRTSRSLIWKTSKRWFCLRSKGHELYVLEVCIHVCLHVHAFVCMFMWLVPCMHEERGKCCGKHMQHVFACLCAQGDGMPRLFLLSRAQTRFEFCSN